MMNDENMNDRELDRLLSSASSPQLPAGFNDRLRQKLNVEMSGERDNVILFPAQSFSRKTSPWKMALPLAASMVAALAVGVYMGAATNVQSLITSSSSIASVDDSDLTGFEELDTALQDGQS